MSVFIVAEIGINHNGDMSICRQLIDVAVDAGCDAVKFQKRDIDSVYTKEFLESARESPWGTTQRQQKQGLEFGLDQYREIDAYCREHKIPWFASAWDLKSQQFLREFDCPFNKVASAMLVYEDLLRMIAEERKKTFVSTGMSTLTQVDRAVEIFQDAKCPFELMHTVSTYPMKDEDANLRVIETLRNRYGCDVGYSGHESGTSISIAAVAIGATSIERHITLGRTMYGSDQAASLEPVGLRHLVGAIRKVEL
ncbi:MAG: N-acetylneuraminate synthase family protein, partial [Actinomycetota bacterium]